MCHRPCLSLGTELVTAVVVVDRQTLALEQFHCLSFRERRQKVDEMLMLLTMDLKGKR